MNRYGKALVGICLQLSATSCGSRSETSTLAVGKQLALAPETSQSFGLQAYALSRSECLENWDALLEEPGVSAGTVGIGNGLLVFPWAQWGRQQFAMYGFELTTPERGAFPVAPGVFSRRFWIEGTDLLYVEDSQLLAVPLTGGGTRSVLEPWASTGADSIISLTVTDDEFLWVGSQASRSGRGPRFGVFRQRRPNGSPERFGTIDSASFEPDEVAKTEDGLLVSGGNQAVVVPFDGGEPRRLSILEDAGSAGMDEQGVYADRVRGAARLDQSSVAYQLRQAPVNGGAVRTIWEGPPGRRLENLHRYENGWIAEGWDTFEDGRHAAVFWLNESGEDSYLGCGPVGSTIRSSPLLDNNALFFSAGDAGGRRFGGGATRRLIRVPLQP